MLLRIRFIFKPHMPHCFNIFISLSYILLKSFYSIASKNSLLAENIFSNRQISNCSLWIFVQQTQRKKVHFALKTNQISCHFLLFSLFCRPLSEVISCSLLFVIRIEALIWTFFWSCSLFCLRKTCNTFDSTMLPEL